MPAIEGKLDKNYFKELIAYKENPVILDIGLEYLKILLYIFLKQIQDR